MISVFQQSKKESPSSRANENTISLRFRFTIVTVETLDELLKALSHHPKKTTFCGNWPLPMQVWMENSIFENHVANAYQTIIFIKNISTPLPVNFGELQKISQRVFPALHKTSTSLLFREDFENLFFVTDRLCIPENTVLPNDFSEKKDNIVTGIDDTNPLSKVEGKESECRTTSKENAVEHLNHDWRQDDDTEPFLHPITIANEFWGFLEMSNDQKWKKTDVDFSGQELLQFIERKSIKEMCENREEKVRPSRKEFATIAFEILLSSHETSTSFCFSLLFPLCDSERDKRHQTKWGNSLPIMLFLPENGVSLLHRDRWEKTLLLLLQKMRNGTSETGSSLLSRKNTEFLLNSRSMTANSLRARRTRQNATMLPPRSIIPTLKDSHALLLRKALLETPQQNLLLITVEDLAILWKNSWFYQFFRATLQGKNCFSNGFLETEDFFVDQMSWKKWHFSLERTWRWLPLPWLLNMILWIKH